MPRVSVIIPNYNHADFLKQRIDSVLNQTFTDIEVIILDDCSTDNSRDVIEQYRNNPGVSSIIYNETNSGSTFRQWNKGVELAKSEIIWIAESDDYADHAFLSVLVPSMLGNERMGIAYSQSLQVDSNNDVIWNFKHFTDALSTTQFEHDFYMGGVEYISKFLIHKNVIPNASGVIFRKKYYQHVGGADPDVKYCSDWYTWLKILLVSDVFYSAKPRNYFRFHGHSVIARAISENKAGKYKEIYDRTMREKLDAYLQKNMPELKIIAKINHRYILDEHGNEGLFEIRNKQWLSGWGKILKSIYTGESGLRYTMHAVKQSVQKVLGRGNVGT